MTPPLLLCISLSGWISGEQVRELRHLANADPAARVLDRLASRGQFTLVPGLRLIDQEAFDRNFLEVCRRSRDIWKREAAWYEKEVADFEALLRAVPAGRLGPNAEQSLGKLIIQMRQGLEDCRAQLEKHDRWVRELEQYVEQRQRKLGREADDAAFDRLRKLRQELWGEPERVVAPMPREVTSQISTPKS